MCSYWFDQPYLCIGAAIHLESRNHWVSVLRHKQGWVFYDDMANSGRVQPWTQEKKAELCQYAKTVFFVRCKVDEPCVHTPIVAYHAYPESVEVVSDDDSDADALGKLYEEVESYMEYGVDEPCP